MIWSEFLDTAKRLLVGATEGDWRSATSRAYYAVFHHFREWLRKEGIDLGSGGQAHNSLYVGLANCGIHDIALIGDRIDDLRRSRSQADYELRRAFTRAGAVSGVREADAIVVDFRSLLGSVPTNAIVQGVKTYLISIRRLPKNSLSWPISIGRITP